MTKKGSLNTNFNSERNFADSLLQGESEVNVSCDVRGYKIAGVLTLTLLSP